jgi:hypothetical protein
LGSSRCFKQNSKALEFIVLLTKELSFVLSCYIHRYQSRYIVQPTGVEDHMNTKLILAALMMSLSLAACGQKDEATVETAPPADVAPAEAPPADATATDETMAPADGMTPPADATTPAEGGDAAEPAPAQ